MGRDIHHRAERRLQSQCERAAEPFDGTIVYSRVHRSVGHDERLRQLLDVAESAYALEHNDDQPDDIRRAGFDAGERLTHEVGSLVESIVCEECHAILVDAEAGWFEDSDVYDRADVKEAVSEARSWIRDHEKAAERVGVDVGDQDGGEPNV
jgi:hypothetical protein